MIGTLTSLYLTNPESCSATMMPASGREVHMALGETNHDGTVEILTAIRPEPSRLSRALLQQLEDQDLEVAHLLAPEALAHGARHM